MRIGRRLAVKILNASRFVLGFSGSLDPSLVTAPVDRALLATLSTVVDDATAAFDAFDYTRALERTEQFFWSFCDDYVELVKARTYGEGDPASVESARSTLALALDTVLRLFAPFLPYVTEDVWSWWREGSVHRAAWPTADSLRAPGSAAGSSSGGDESLALTVAAEVLRAIRRAKSAAKQSMRAEVAELRIAGDPVVFEQVRDDVVAAGNVRDVVVTEADSLTATVTL
jgi:valyl-tRNA synthetase